MDSSTQDGEGFDDANQNLNGYWKLGGPSYKITFPILFMELFNEAFFFGGVARFFGSVFFYFFSKFEYFF